MISAELRNYVIQVKIGFDNKIIIGYVCYFNTSLTDKRLPRRVEG